MTKLIASIPLRTALFAAAFVAAAIAFHGWTALRDVHIAHAVAFIDITGSMNARDAGPSGQKLSRLEAARAAVRELAQRLPCGSQLGLGIFTERRAFLLFEPVNICKNYEAFDGALADVDWRMAWEGDSYIARGLFSAIDIAKPLSADVIFLTDAHEAPPLPHTGIVPFEGKRSDVKGLLVGIGGEEKVPIPKFDNDGRETGTWGVMDVPHVNRHGLPPINAENAPNYHPRNAPHGGDLVVGDEHLTYVHSAHMKKLAAITGLAMVLYKPGTALAPLLLDAASKRVIETTVNLAQMPATLALILGTSVFFLAASGLIRRRFVQTTEGPTV